MSAEDYIFEDEFESWERSTMEEDYDPDSEVNQKMARLESESLIDFLNK